MPSWRGAQWKQRDNFTFTLPYVCYKCSLLIEICEVRSFGLIPLVLQTVTTEKFSIKVNEEKLQSVCLWFETRWRYELLT
jgi:hypothetical protein